jgi:hypothetical protein
MLSACSALRVPQNPSRAYALCGFWLHHIFSVAGKLRFPLSQPQKRHIPKTLCEIKIELVGGIFKYKLTKYRIYERIDIIF